MKVIDISSYQLVDDFHAVKQDGIEAIILRTVLKNGSIDKCFEKYYTEFTQIEMPIAVYVFSYDLSYQEGVARARKVINTIKNKNIKFVALDLEWATQRAKGKLIVGQVIQAYLDVFASTGIEIIGYWNLDWHKNVIPEAYKDKIRYWIARYPKEDNGFLKSSLKPNIGEAMWQYSSKGRVKGIKGPVDMNECYCDLFGKQSSSNPIIQPKNPFIEPTYTLHRFRVGMSKEYVKWLQYELNKMGYGLVIDGLFGNKTNVALRDAQKRLSVTIDGKCGVQTVSALKK